MANRLGSQTSPYLLQHADNPVDWMPWDDEALARAKAEQKPILLSIGYSACHWCHVMAHESFEDPVTAAVMNEHYVNVKVDREERPDLDKVYQLADPLLTRQSGGWPLTMFLDPETLLPFYGGTYFPRTARLQLPGFSDLLLRVAEAWRERRDALKEQGERMTDVLESLTAPETEVPAPEPEELLEQAVEQLRGQYDVAEGGFGNAPKFPMPGTLERVLRHWSRGGERGDLDMVMITLTRMARGGIYDHLRGGFCRYATDRKWQIPHFEKMLYDNGQLLSVYADALSIGPDELFSAAVRETAQWLLEDMRHPAGGFYAALDADSDGEEGAYYIWRRDVIKRLLNDDEYLLIETLYGIDKPANFEGKWNLHRTDAWRSVVARLSLEPAQAADLLSSARAKLLTARRERTPPGLDDKLLTAWNALAVKGLVKAAVVLDEPAWLDAACRCVDFLRDACWVDGTLYATWKGSPGYRGYLDDYANLLDALLVLLSARWRAEDAEWALALADAAIERFEDSEHGGFFFAAEDADLIHRPKPTLDDALPPGNATLVQALVRLGHLFGRAEYLDVAYRALAWAAPKVQQYPAGHCQLLSAMEVAEGQLEQIVIRGPRTEAHRWLAATRRGLKPLRVAYAIPYGAEGVLPDYLPRLVSAEASRETVAYRCEGLTCGPPIRSLDELEG